MTEPLLLTSVQITTFDGKRLLTQASGFFFERAAHLYLVTTRHVLIDEASGHSRTVLRSSGTSTPPI